jgi:hypothetical protein
MRLDMTITIGTLLQIGATVIAVGVAYAKLREQLATIDTKLAPLWDEYTDRRKIHRRSEDRE